jgi:hypothetical protein
VIRSGSQYINNENSPGVNNKYFYKRLKLEFPDLTSAGDQAWCLEYMGECIVTEPYTQSSGEIEYPNLVTTLSCLNIENNSTERLLSINNLA